VLGVKRRKIFGYYSLPFMVKPEDFNHWIIDFMNCYKNKHFHHCRLSLKLFSWKKGSTDFLKLCPFYIDKH
jgi:hypothetical protein